MANTSGNVPVKRVSRDVTQATSAVERLHREIDRLFEEFEQGLWPFPFRRMELMEPFRKEMPWSAAPAVDVVEKEKAYEITAELPGMSERDVEVTLSNGMITIRGEKKEETKEETEGYYLSERRYGAFARRFRVPEGADPSKAEAVFKNGVLTVTLPKTAEAQKPEQKIAIKAA